MFANLHSFKVLVRLTVTLKVRSSSFTTRRMCMSAEKKEFILQSLSLITAPTAEVISIFQPMFLYPKLQDNESDPKGSRDVSRVLNVP